MFSFAMSSKVVKKLFKKNNIKVNYPDFQEWLKKCRKSTTNIKQVISQKTFIINSLEF